MKKLFLAAAVFYGVPSSAQSFNISLYNGATLTKITSPTAYSHVNGHMSYLLHLDAYKVTESGFYYGGSLGASELAVRGHIRLQDGHGGTLAFSDQVLSVALPAVNINAVTGYRFALGKHNVMVDFTGGYVLAYDEDLTRKYLSGDGFNAGVNAKYIYYIKRLGFGAEFSTRYYSLKKDRRRYRLMTYSGALGVHVKI